MKSIASNYSIVDRDEHHGHAMEAIRGMCQPGEPSRALAIPSQKGNDLPRAPRSIR